MRNVFKVVLEHLLRDFGFTDRNLLDGLAIRCGLRGHVADASTKEILAPIDNEGSVVDGIYLSADKHHAHALSHSHSDVVDEESHFFSHLFKNSVNYKGG